MTDPIQPKRGRWAAPALIAILAAVIVVVVVIGVVSAVNSPRNAAASSSSAVPASSSGASSPTAPSSSSTPSTASTPAPTEAKPVPASRPQPTKTAAISAPTTIVKALTAKVEKLESVKGTATGPGEVGGPSVRFTIVITNSTGKTVQLANTVVNAYFGAGATPAIELEKPGGAAFPASVKSGSSATGVFIFNIPEASRSKVEVTVDTSVDNPVIAFRGSAPR